MENSNIVTILQNLIRFKTVNPPGEETDCIKYIKNLLESEGIECILVGKDSNRQNLIACLKGNSNHTPFLMYGHVDVVPAQENAWKFNPFSGDIHENCVWGRGALDMKGGLAMMISAILHMKKNNIQPNVDIILCVLADEEAGGEYGAEYVVNNYSDLFKGIKYAIGEIGGVSLPMSGKKFYPIMVAEKQTCNVKITIKGPGGHGSMPFTNGTMAKLGEILTILNKSKLPVHITEASKMMINGLANNLSFPKNIILKSLLTPTLTNVTLKLLGKNGKFFDPILHNTVNATIVNGGNKINVIPEEITLQLDGRLLPGFTPDKFLKELKILIGEDVEIEIIRYAEGPGNIDMNMFDTLANILKENDKEAIPVPFIVSGVTDSRYFSKLGIQTYGFTPMNLPEDLNFSTLIHGVDERIPLESLKFGQKCVIDLLTQI